MKINILGCSGGIGEGLRTTSLLLNDTILIDSGTGVGDLGLEQLKKIRHIFVTHTHLDHIADAPLLVDTIFDELLGNGPLIIHGTAVTISALKGHVFNNVIWPDFACIPSAEKPVLAFEVMEPGQAKEIDGCTINMIPVNHVVPAVAYRVESETGSFAFSSDTTTNDSLWEGLNSFDSLDLLIVEAAFSNKEMDLCQLAYHYCPSLLGEDLKKLKHQPDIRITHLKPGSEDLIMRECREAIVDREFSRLVGGEIIEI